MPLSKKYMHDKMILALVSVNILFAIICIILVLLRFGADGASGYIVQYRANLGISAFKTGDAGGILSFALFAPLIAAINIVLSVRIYEIRRQLAVTILALGAFILALAIIVSNALLVLR